MDTTLPILVIHHPGWMRVEGSQHFALMLRADTEDKAWDSDRAFQIFDRELPGKCTAIPISRVPAVSNKFSQRITAVHDMASTLHFLNPLVLLRIYLCL